MDKQERKEIESMVGKFYTHYKNGILYKVKYIANIAHIHEDYPISVVYESVLNHNIYVKTLDNFREKMVGKDD